MTGRTTELKVKLGATELVFLKTPGQELIDDNFQVEIKI